MSYSEILEKAAEGQDLGLALIIMAVMLLVAGIAYGIECLIRRRRHPHEHLHGGDPGHSAEGQSRIASSGSSGRNSALGSRPQPDAGDDDDYRR